MKKPLVQASLLLLALQVAHTVDHLVGHPADTVGQIPGYLGFATVLGTLYLVASDNPLGPLAAAATGFFTAVGLVAIHLAPHWGIFSDPYSKLDLGFVSWAIVFATILSSLWLGVLGVRAMIAERSTQPAT
ncbi:MAG: hypothetical protein ACXWDP_04355 [Solirubrobacterales bacterium]